jgi:hypothetical protein
MPDDMDDHSDAALSENEDESETFSRSQEGRMAEQNSTEGNGEVKKKYDPKDPLRPRRKKARRACYACQRAHLTCGK